MALDLCIFLSWFRQDGFSIKQAILVDSNLAISNVLKLKLLNDGFVYYKHAAFHFTRCNLLDCICVDYLWIIVMFLSAVRTLILTAPIQLQRNHWWASDVMLHFSKSVLMKKQTHLHLRCHEGVHFQQMFIFVKTSECSFKSYTHHFLYIDVL